MKNKNKDLAKKSKIKGQETYNIWGQYNSFIRQLYLEKPLKKPTGRQLTLKYLNKLAIVFAGAFFTTLTFYFLIDPNGIYNSGLNGLIQAFSKLIVGHTEISWGWYYFLYYGLGLLTNLLFILFLRFLFKAKLEIISTSIFYVISQIIWTQIFKLTHLKEYIFSRFNPSSWQGLSTNSQLSFTLPYYIVIAILAAIIHTYGYSLIFQAQATPGGLEIFTSHFSSSQKEKSKFSISSFMKVFGIGVIFAVTLINFAWIEDNPKMKESILKKEIIEALEKTEEREEVKRAKVAEVEKKGIKNIIDEWKKDIIKVKQLSKEKGKKEESIKIKEKNSLLTSILKNKIGDLGNSQLENYPQEVDYYLVSDKERIEQLTNEITKIDRDRESLPEENLEESLYRRNDLEKKKRKLEEERKRSVSGKYLSYITNNERLWATVVYIFLSSFLISQIFPRDQIVLLRLYSLTEEEQKKGLKLLAKHSPTCHTVYRKNEEKEETIYVTSCYLSKWNYYLITPYLKQIGKTYINEANQ